MICFASCLLSGPDNVIRYDVFTSSTVQSSPPTDAEVFARYLYAGQAAAINFDWSTGSPLGSASADNVSVVFSAYVKVTSAGGYVFCVAANDGAQLYLDGSLQLDAWSSVEAAVPADRCMAAAVNLEVGMHRFVLKYREATGSAYVALKWECGSCSPAIARTVIPTANYGADVYFACMQSFPCFFLLFLVFLFFSFC